jgi:hypothetical protein
MHTGSGLLEELQPRPLDRALEDAELVVRGPQRLERRYRYFGVLQMTELTDSGWSASNPLPRRTVPFPAALRRFGRGYARGVGSSRIALGVPPGVVAPAAGCDRIASGRAYFLFFPAPTDAQRSGKGLWCKVCWCVAVLT